MRRLAFLVAGVLAAISITAGVVAFAVGDDPLSVPRNVWVIGGTTRVVTVTWDPPTDERVESRQYNRQTGLMRTW